MGFVHDFRVAFFGNPQEEGCKRDLLVDECLALFREFCRLAPESLDCEITPRKGNQHNQLIGMCDGLAIILHRGWLSCPFIHPRSDCYSSMTFAAYVKTKTGCSIYSEYHDDFLTVQEITQLTDFPEEFRDFLNTL
jgi:hypothetical protein